MSWSRPAIAKAVVLASIYLVCFIVVLKRHQASKRDDAPSDRVTIRIGHWLVHTGMREAFDEAIREYEKLNPHIDVEQIAVPVRAYPSWVRTRLIGENAPDLTGMNHLGEEPILRHFLPLGEFLEQPNPHNVGSPLEGVRWRDTFIDGLNAVANITPSAGNVYGANLQINSFRLFYNRQLLKEATGLDAPPEDFAGLMALGPVIEAYGKSRGKRIAPIASCGPYASFLFGMVLPSQTQRLLPELSPLGNLQLNPSDYAVQYLAGNVSFSTPGLRSSLELMKDISTLLPPGFMQLQRDDALFAFTQGKTVMLYAGTWDYGLLATEAPFDTGITHMPLPSTDDPRFGRFVNGPIAENAMLEATFGVVRSSRHTREAVDFLRFLTSRRMADMFSRMSHRMSSVVGAELPAETAKLQPRTEGEVNGFSISFTPLGGGHAFNVFQRHMHRTFGTEGDVDATVEALDRDLPRALRRDLDAHTTYLLSDVQRLDPHIVMNLIAPAMLQGRRDPTAVAEHQHIRSAELLLLQRELPSQNTGGSR